MLQTGYVQWMYKFSGCLQPRDSFKWSPIGFSKVWGISDYPITAKLANTSSYRHVTHVGFGPYGFGLRFKNIVFFQSELPERTWAWDEFRYIKLSRLLGASYLETNEFKIGFEIGSGDEAPLRFLARLSAVICFSRFAAGLNPPLIEQPLSEGVINAEGLPVFFRNGFPYFTAENYLSFAQELIGDLNKLEDPSILMPDS
jgi:hypothetical protein